MTTLAGLTVGEAFILLARVAGIDGGIGMTLIFFGPDAGQQGTMVISPAGEFSGQLQADPSVIPVTTVAEMNAVSVGDVLQNAVTGETAVARQVRIRPDGSYQWASSLTAAVWYGVGGWTAIGQVSL